MVWCLAPVFVRGSVQARALVGSLSINKHPNIFTLEPFTEKYADSRGADVCDVGGARLGEKRKDNIKKTHATKVWCHTSTPHDMLRSALRDTVGVLGCVVHGCVCIWE